MWAYRHVKVCESLSLIDVGGLDACPDVRAYVHLRACEVVAQQVWAACCTWGCSSSYWTLFTSPGADDERTRVHTHTHTHRCAPDRNVNRYEIPRVRRQGGGGAYKSYAPTPPTKNCMTSVCAYALQKHVRSHMTVTFVLFSVAFLFFSLHSDVCVNSRLN